MHNILIWPGYVWDIVRLHKANLILIMSNICTDVQHCAHTLSVCDSITYISPITVLHTMPHYKINGFCPTSFCAPVVPCVYQPTCQSLQEEFDQRNAHYESRKKEVIGIYMIYITLIAHAFVTCQGYICFIANLQYCRRSSEEQLVSGSRMKLYDYSVFAGYSQYL